MLIDIHSHHIHGQPLQKQFVTLEASLADGFRDTFSDYGKDVLLSVGIHPWQAIRWNLDDCPALMELFLDTHVKMIGEVGLDKNSTVDFNVQKLVFNAQIEMAEKVRKPVLLHVVHTMPEILACKKMHNDIPAWIIHGFRGGREEAEQYAQKGFYLSFGLRFNNEGLLACPVDRIFLETDESLEGLSAVYEKVAQVLQCPVSVLEKQVEGNFSAIFKT
jgi:TatD DNase family protein